METIGDTLILWIDGEPPYVFRNSTISGIDLSQTGNTNGYQDILMKLHGKLESKNGTIRMSFTDGRKTISVENFVLVAKDYGSLEEMSYDEFKERLLVLEI